MGPRIREGVLHRLHLGHLGVLVLHGVVLLLRGVPLGQDPRRERLVALNQELLVAAKHALELGLEPGALPLKLDFAFCLFGFAPGLEKSRR